MRFFAYGDIRQQVHLKCIFSEVFDTVALSISPVFLVVGLEACPLQGGYAALRTGVEVAESVY